MGFRPFFHSLHPNYYLPYLPAFPSDGYMLLIFFTFIYNSQISKQTLNLIVNAKREKVNRRRKKEYMKMKKDIKNLKVPHNMN